MKRKFVTLFLGLGFAVTTGFTNYSDSSFPISPVLAQSESEELSLKPMDIERLDAKPRLV